MPLTPRNKTIVKAFIVALFASPVAVNLMGWNCFLVWYGEAHHYHVGAANGTFYSFSKPSDAAWGRPAASEPVNLNWQPRIHERRIGPFGALTAQRFGDMRWFGFDWYTDANQLIFEFPWLLIPAWVALMIWLRHWRRSIRSAHPGSGHGV